MPRDPENRYGFKLLQSARSTIDSMGWQGLGQSIIGTLVLGVVFGFIDVLNSFFEIFATLFDVIATILIDINEATFGGIADFLAASFDAGASSFNTGWTALLGVFQTPFGIGVALLTLFMVAYYLDYVNSDILGTNIDVPFITSDESAAAGDEGE